MDTEVDVPNPSLVLMPGMYAEVDLTLARRNRVLTIPVTAIDNNHQVMVVTPNNRVELRKLGDRPGVVGQGRSDQRPERRRPGGGRRESQPASRAKR